MLGFRVSPQPVSPMQQYGGMKTKKMKQGLRTLIARRSSTSALSFLARAAEGYLRAWWNEANWDMQSNGEELVLRTVLHHSARPAPLVVDVGLNRGDWTLRVLSLAPGARVHAFEIVPQTFEHAVKMLGSKENVHLNNLGLSSQAGELSVAYLPNNDTGSSISGAPWNVESASVRCAVDRFDSYVDRNNLGPIDFMKIDVEGHEFDVLLGARETLDKGMIETIQFEYGKHTIFSRRNLKDFYEILSGLGYKIGRIHPGYVDFKEYDFQTDENYRSGNFIATRNSEIARTLGIQ